MENIFFPESGNWFVYMLQGTLSLRLPITQDQVQMRESGTHYQYPDVTFNPWLLGTYIKKLHILWLIYIILGTRFYFILFYFILFYFYF